MLISSDAVKRDIMKFCVMLISSDAKKQIVEKQLSMNFV